MAARDCYAAAGGAPARIRLTGGAARSHALCAVLASVLDRPVIAAGQPEAGTAGAAMIAAVQQGVFADMRDCAATWIGADEAAWVLPQPDLVAFYDRLFPVYRAAYQALRPTWHDLHSVRGMARGAADAH
jgi:erythritol kinase